MFTDGFGLDGGVLYCSSGKVPLSPVTPQRTWLVSWMGLIFAWERLSHQHQQSPGGAGVPPGFHQDGC